MTKTHTKSGRVANKPLSQPFQVWQMDAYGPLPVTQNRNSCVFTARDMFSKYLFTMAMPNMDSITVSQALFQLICHIGIGDCIIHDNGNSFISQCTAAVCKLLNITENFKPIFIHHCLELC